jgi:hypothetical protein
VLLNQGIANMWISAQALLRDEEKERSPRRFILECA